MATKYFGDSFYKESLLVRCACKEHMIEIFAYDGPENMEYGITCITPCNRKVKRGVCPDFYFGNFTEFKDFVQYMHEIEFGGSFAIDSHLDNNRSNGILLVNNDLSGWIDIVRYMNKRDRLKNKPMWDICLEQVHFNKLLKELDSILEKCVSLEVNKMGLEE